MTTDSPDILARVDASDQIAELRKFHRPELLHKDFDHAAVADFLHERDIEYSQDMLIVISEEDRDRLYGVKAPAFFHPLTGMIFLVPSDSPLNDEGNVVHEAGHKSGRQDIWVKRLTDEKDANPRYTVSEESTGIMVRHTLPFENTTGVFLEEGYVKFLQYEYLLRRVHSESAIGGASFTQFARSFAYLTEVYDQLHEEGEFMQVFLAARQTNEGFNAFRDKLQKAFSETFFDMLMVACSSYSDSDDDYEEYILVSQMNDIMTYLRKIKYGKKEEAEDFARLALMEFLKGRSSNEAEDT
ncbi:MAG: hypothetical protein TR69_WS6001000884 [candidate division WS6 bacterium OLB20]|uniref:Uncharacterized protein n=1 Tax=candidate division WS6 bacterium OLB20 TaxID=1617426 RepID=A0A136LYY6_9BACT|nr:MAG: hypothetical protein TR69_WS6001000884 [candidate division WS6 bacterium OLB20]